MHIKRFSEATAYAAPNHVDIRTLRLQGFEAEGPQGFSVGISQLLPGGSAGPDSSPLEKVYIVLAGEVTITSGSATAVLLPLDSCRIAPHEERFLTNASNHVASMLVVMPYPDKSAR